jgi:transposase
VQGKEIAKRVGITPEYVSRIRKRFESSGVDGLAERKRAGRKDHAVPAETIERIIQTALSPPPAGY